MEKKKKKKSLLFQYLAVQNLMLYQKKSVFETDHFLLFINIPSFLLYTFIPFLTHTQKKRKKKKAIQTVISSELQITKKVFLSVRGWS